MSDSSPPPGSQERLDSVVEDVVDPDAPIIDPHHHLWPDGEGMRYGPADLLADLASGHRVVDTVFVECGAGLYADAAFRAGVARLGERGLTYDTWHHHSQNCDVLERARAVPGTSMVLVAKIGGLAMPDNGPGRCMFESNFPVDRLSLSYRVVWNGFKKMVADFSGDERDAILRGTAARVYRR